jgi:hypothetical protein
MPLDIIDTWKARFAEVGAEPIMLIGVRPDGSSHLAVLTRSRASGSTCASS